MTAWGTKVVTMYSRSSQAIRPISRLRGAARLHCRSSPSRPHALPSSHHALSPRPPHFHLVRHG
jgi:hypothetical protein